MASQSKILSQVRPDGLEDAPQLQIDIDRDRAATLGITAAFGLIHGLGFASVLGELGVSAGETVAALAFFNVGVELGQLLFVAAVLVLFAVLTRLRMVTTALPAALCAAGGMGLFWTLQRVIA